MKKFIAFLLLFGILLSPSLSANTSSGKDSVKKLVLKPTNPRPRDVTHDNVVECTVDNGWLTITFSDNGYFEMGVFDTTKGEGNPGGIAHNAPNKSRANYDFSVNVEYFIVK